MAQSFHIAPHLQQKISSEQAFHYRIVPVAMEEDAVVFKTDQKDLQGLLAELQIVLDQNLRLSPCDEHDLSRYLNTNYRQQKKDNDRALGYSNDFLEKILLNAKQLGSSDIHFEPYEERCRVRYRLDGKLLEQYSIPLTDYPTMVNKVKIRAHLDIAEKRLPQDGRITLKTAQEEFDLRVSTLPTLFGEKMVLRILNRDSGAVDITSLGFSETELHTYLQGIKKPHGIILLSGPTGSGKTTTLYATLKLLNTEAANILTIEDPIEYTLEGVNQVQLKEAIGLDFASSLRTFLRQDPDIIMVGEIRDVKTANMAIRAALTGHLVLSTIHTNSAWGTISRLIDMGVPAFLIASTLTMSVAQRLVRKLCNHCKTKEPLEDKDAVHSSIAQKLTHHYKANGCAKCHHTGYSGRKAVYEILPITEELGEAMKNNDLEIDAYIKKRGIRTLKENALSMIQEGTTTVEEVFSLLTT